MLRCTDVSADLHAARLEGLAALAVEVAANVGDGQTVIIHGSLPDAPLVREIVRAAYRQGAHYVDVFWDDVSHRLRGNAKGVQHYHYGPLGHALNLGKDEIGGLKTRAASSGWPAGGRWSP